MANIYSQYGGKCVGRIEKSGVVYDRQYGGNSIGRVEGVPTKMGGAAIIFFVKIVIKRCKSIYLQTVYQHISRKIFQQNISLGG